MRLWIARDKDGTLCLFEYRPIRNEDNTAFIFAYIYLNYPTLIFPEGYMEIKDKTLFPELTFENSPQLTELKMID